jgi:hypothetical protein
VLSAPFLLWNKNGFDFTYKQKTPYTMARTTAEYIGSIQAKLDGFMMQEALMHREMEHINHRIYACMAHKDYSRLEKYTFQKTMCEIQQTALVQSIIKYEGRLFELYRRRNRKIVEL